MKIVTVIEDEQAFVGVQTPKGIFLPRRSTESKDDARFETTLSLIWAGRSALQHLSDMCGRAATESFLDPERAILGAPIYPSTILCAGSNYRDHNKEKLSSPVSGLEPEFFVKTADSVIGPERSIPYDEKLTTKLDCETELAIVIGKPGRHISKAQALDHVFGYTIVNDVTARDRQVRRKGEFTWYELGRGKAFDGSAPLGPCIVTADEIPDPQTLALSTRINGEQRQSASTEEMIWTCADLIHFFSINFTLKPGMVIITGTPAGTAWSTDADLGGNWQAKAGIVPASRYCLPGDVIECEIEKIGILRNPIGRGVHVWHGSNL